MKTTEHIAETTRGYMAVFIPCHAKKSDTILLVPLFCKISHMLQIALAHLRQHRIAVCVPDRLVEDFDLDRPAIAG